MRPSKRRLRKDFIDFMRERRAFPKPTIWTTRIRKDLPETTLKSGYLAALFDGDYSDPKVAEKFVRYVQHKGRQGDKGRKEDEDPTYLAVRDYVHAINGSAVLLLEPEQVADMILDTEKDDLLDGYRRFLQLCLSHVPLVNAAMPSPDLNICDAVEWMYVVAGRFAEPAASIDRAIEIAATKVIRTPFDEFVRKAEEWQDLEPWTTVLSIHKKRKVGMSIILPLKLETYQAIRAGEQVPQDVTKSDLQRPSPYLFLCGVAERPPDCGGPDRNVTTNLHMSLMWQVAALTNCKVNESEVPIQLLSVAPSDLSEHRLTTGGFRPVGRKAKNSDHQLFERLTPWDLNDTTIFLLRSTLHSMAVIADLAHPPKPKPVHTT